MASVFRIGEIEPVREFYRLAGYKGGVKLDDALIGASVEGDLVGVVRIATEHGIQVLRGMRVKPEFQRQGIGARMLREVRPLLRGRECFAIAYAHLENFYGRIGFRKIDEQVAPVFLRERIEAYRQQNPQLEFILIRTSGAKEGEGESTQTLCTPCAAKG